MTTVTKLTVLNEARIGEDLIYVDDVLVFVNSDEIEEYGQGALDALAAYLEAESSSVTLELDNQDEGSWWIEVDKGSLTQVFYEINDSEFNLKFSQR